jgi:hypothetical protein
MNLKLVIFPRTRIGSQNTIGAVPFCLLAILSICHFVNLSFCQSVSPWQNKTCGLYYKNILANVSYTCTINVSLALTLSLAGIVSYNRMWCFNLECCLLTTLASSFMIILCLWYRPMVWVFNSRRGRACVRRAILLITKTAQLKVENLARATFRFSPITSWLNNLLMKWPADEMTSQWNDQQLSFDKNWQFS